MRPEFNSESPYTPFIFRKNSLSKKSIILNITVWFRRMISWCVQDDPGIGLQHSACLLTLPSTEEEEIL